MILAVADTLAAQNARLPPSPQRDAGLERLRAGAAAVVTGQQVGLFLGPLYTIYKTASAIRVAQALGAVPVFWLQTEDHDLPECASCGLPDAVVALPASPDDRVSVAHVRLPDAVAGAHAELRALVGGHVHAGAHLERLARHYRPGAGWAQAFAGVLAELFADEGLVFCDPRDPGFAGPARAVHARAIADAPALAAAILDGPVHVRPGAPLSFFHPDGATGPRTRLEPAGPGRYGEVGGRRVWSTAELQAALDADPLRFSTSALLRPILQDTLLPTAAYVGGPAEVRYFAQLPPLYAAYGLSMPRIVARARFRLVDAPTRRLLERLGLEPADSARPEDELLARCRGASQTWPTGAELARRLTDPYDQAQLELADTFTSAAPHLARELARARAAMARAVGRLTAKYDRALLHRDAARVADVRRLAAILQPDGVPQERRHGLPYFAARCGDRELVEKVLAATEPFVSTLKDLPL